MKVLVTGFDPFDGETVNPAWEAVKHLPSNIEGHGIDKLEIPTVFDESIEVIKAHLAKHHYDIVIAVGQAGGRYGITPERVAININDARIPDNQKQQPIDVPIQKDGAAAYFSKLPVKRMVEAIRDCDIPASLSNSAGTFVCNHIIYQLAYLAETTYPQLKTGFIHVPFAPKQVVDKPDKPSMSVALMTKGLEAAIKVCLKFDEDNNIALGSTH